MQHYLRVQLGSFPTEPDPVIGGRMSNMNGDDFASVDASFTSIPNR